MPSAIFYSIDAISLLYLCIALTGSYGIGSILKIRGTAERCFIGLGLNAVFLSLILFTKPNLIVEVSTFFTCVGLSGTFALFYKSYRESSNKNGLVRKCYQVVVQFLNLNKKAKFLMSQNLKLGGISIALTLWMFPSFFIFENHDLAYFGFLANVVNEGNLELDFAFPMEMGLANTLPSLFLVPLTLPIGSAEFLDFIFLRGFLVFFFTFLILKRFLCLCTNLYFQVLIGGLGALLFIWGAEWAYVMLVSSFTPAIGLVIASISIVEGRRQPNALVLIFMLVGLCKAPILAVSLVTILYLLLSKNWRPSHSFTLLALSLLSLSVFSWIHAPKGLLASDTKFTFLGFGVNSHRGQPLLSFQFKEWVESFSALSGWVPDYTNVMVGNFLYPLPAAFKVLGTIFFIFWVAFKYFLLYGIVRMLLFRHSGIGLQPLDVWIIACAVSIVFVRNGEESLWLGHQAHAFILSAIPSSVFALGLVIKSERMIETIPSSFRMLLATLLVVLGTLSSTSTIGSRTVSESAITLRQANRELAELEIKEGFIIANNENYGRLQTIAAIMNKKFLFQLDGTQTSVANKFVVLSGRK